MGFGDHIAHVCAPFFKGIESMVLNMKIGDIDGRRSIDMPKWPWGTTVAPPAVLTGEPGSGTSENLRQQNQVSPRMSPGGAGL